MQKMLIRIWQKEKHSNEREGFRAFSGHGHTLASEVESTTTMTSLTTKTTTMTRTTISSAESAGGAVSNPIVIDLEEDERSVRSWRDCTQDHHSNKVRMNSPSFTMRNSNVNYIAQNRQNARQHSSCWDLQSDSSHIRHQELVENVSSFIKHIVISKTDNNSIKSVNDRPKWRNLTSWWGSYPVKKLADLNQTIVEAGIQNSAILQKLLVWASNVFEKKRGDMIDNNIWCVCHDIKLCQPNDNNLLFKTTMSVWNVSHPTAILSKRCGDAYTSCVTL